MTKKKRGKKNHKCLKEYTMMIITYAVKFIYDINNDNLHPANPARAPHARHVRCYVRRKLEGNKQMGKKTFRFVPFFSSHFFSFFNCAS